MPELPNSIPEILPEPGLYMENNDKIPALLNTPKLPSLDGLRAISIILVIISHLFFNSTFADNTAFGYIGVEIFFVISGFLITTLLLKEKTLKNKISLRDFYIRRALRILPVALLFLTVLFILNQVFILKISNVSFLTAVLFVKNIPVPSGSDWYTGHFWTLAVEEQFYLIFPFLISYLSIKRYKQIIILLIVTFPIISFCFYNNIGVFYSVRSIHLISLLFVNLFGNGTGLILTGSLLSVLMFENSRVTKWLENSGRGYSIIFIIIAFVIRMPFFNLYFPFFSDTVFGFFIGFIIILNLKEKSVLYKILNLKLFVQIGILSYSLYIWQQIFTHYQPWGKSFMYADSKILNSLSLIIVAYLSYWFFEKKFLNYKLRFKQVE
jgi:peptidoglycan/LPS O-acetylase OafA/YrhL